MRNNKKKNSCNQKSSAKHQTHPPTKPGIFFNKSRKIVSQRKQREKSAITQQHTNSAGFWERDSHRKYIGNTWSFFPFFFFSFFLLFFFSSFLLFFFRIYGNKMLLTAHMHGC